MTGEESSLVVLTRGLNRTLSCGNGSIECPSRRKRGKRGSVPISPVEVTHLGMQKLRKQVMASAGDCLLWPGIKITKHLVFSQNHINRRLWYLTYLFETFLCLHQGLYFLKPSCHLVDKLTLELQRNYFCNPA